VSLFILIAYLQTRNMSFEFEERASTIAATLIEALISLEKNF